MAFTATQLERYARHFVLPGVGVAGQKRLLESKVLVIGAGALGSAALMYLAAAGIGTIGIVDYDVVSLSNLQRQIIHRTGTIDEYKTVSAKKTIHEINPDVNVDLYCEGITTENIVSIISKYDFIIDATDNFETKFLINDACVLAKKPYSHAGIVRFTGQTFTYVPGKGPCLRCILGKVPERDSSMTCAQAGVMGSAVGVLSSIQATEAIKYILGIGELLVGRILCFDGLNMIFTTVNAIASTGCSVCGENPSILSLEDNKDEYIRKGCGI